MGTVLGGKVAASGGCGWGAGLGRILATGPGWRQSRRPARMRCSDAGRPLAWHQWGWWVRSAGGGECGGEGILVCVVWRVELVGADVGPQRVPDPVGVHGDAVVVADEVGRAVGEAEFVAGLHVRGGGGQCRWGRPGGAAVGGGRAGDGVGVAAGAVEPAGVHGAVAGGDPGEELV